MNQNENLDQASSKINLSSSTTIIVTNQDNQPIQYSFSYNEDIRENFNKNKNFLGSGRFGVVYRVNHSASGINFAVKRIKIENNTNIMDITIPNRLGDDCPFIIKFYGQLTAEQGIWIISELMDTSLYKFYKKAFELNINISELLVSKVAYAVVNAIQYMKEFQTMHRDIKPSNILINRTGQIKLCDFGISNFNNDSVFRTYTGDESYMSPERIHTTGGGYSFESDIWSLGISLIEIATGIHPFSNERCNPCALVSKILFEPPPTLNENQFSSEFKAYVDMCLSKEKDLRPCCEKLLLADYIVNYSNQDNDLELIQRVISSI